MIRALLADDHPVIVDGLHRYLDSIPHVEVVGTASSLQGALEIIDTHRVDVVVLDVNMPGMEGANTVRKLSHRLGFPHIVVFSMLEEDSFAVSILQAGAKAYLSKTRSPAELLEAIERASEGRSTVTDTLAAQLIGDPRSPTPLHDELSGRERQVFALLVRGRTPKQIASDLSLSASTVHTYTERVKDKLRVDSIPEIIRYAFRHGLAS